MTIAKDGKVTAEEMKKAQNNSYKLTALIYVIGAVAWAANAGMLFYSKYTYGTESGFPFPMALCLAVTSICIAISYFCKARKVKKEIKNG